MEGTLSDESDISTLTLEDAITALYADGSAYSGAMGFGNEGGMGMMGPMDDMMREEPQEQGGQQPPQPMRGG